VKQQRFVDTVQKNMPTQAIIIRNEAATKPSLEDGQQRLTTLRRYFADEFIERKGREAREGRYDHTWVAEFKNGLAAHREGKAIPRNGTALITWERILKSRREQLVQRFPTVEDLAAVPDSSLGEIGLDGRVLRDMAKADIQAKRDLSPVVKELDDTKEENRRLQEQLDALTARLDRMDEDKPRRRRPEPELG
jgi:hypothetical protein